MIAELRARYWREMGNHTKNELESLIDALERVQSYYFDLQTLLTDLGDMPNQLRSSTSK